MGRFVTVYDDTVEAPRSEGAGRCDGFLWLRALRYLRPGYDGELDPIAIARVRSLSVTQSFHQGSR